MRQKITTFLKRVQHTVTARFFVASVALCILAVAGFVYWQEVAVFLGIRSAQAAGYQMQTGYYVGNGASQAISGLGFAPELVIIKADTNAGQGAIMKTISMPQNNTAYLGSATLDSTTGLINLTDDGFIVTGANSNTANARFTWVAFAGSDCSAGGQFCVGTYTGTGLANKSITTGFQPDMVLVKTSAAVAANWRSSAMPDNYGQYFMATAQNTAGLLFTTLDATGFTVGATNNTASGIFYYVAFKESAGTIDVGTYGGSGTDNTNISGVGFQPSWIFTKQTGAVGAVHSMAESYGDYSSYFTDTANLVNAIQALQADGFQLGTSNTANAAVTTYYYAAFGGVSAPPVASGSFASVSGSYVGNGGSQVIGNLGFAPDLVIIKASSTDGAVYRTRLMAGDTTGYLGLASADIADAITALNPTSFAIGNHATVNAVGVTYYWTAYGNAWNPATRTGSVDFMIGAYTGNGIDSRDVTGVPFRPDFVALQRSTYSAVWRTSEHAGDLSSYLTATAEAANIIQALNDDGFQVGIATNIVNTAGALYRYFAFATGTNFSVGTYSGTGIAQTIATPFEPDQVWAKRTAATQGVLRTSGMQSSSSAPFINAAPVVQALTSIVPTGFVVGTAAEANSVGANNYRYATWRDTTTVGTANYRMQTGYYIGNGATKEIPVGFAPDAVIITAETTAGTGAILKTSAMPETSTAYLGTLTADGVAGLVTFSANGFRVAGTNSNTANARFMWVAFTGSDCSASGQFCVGRYIGDGASPRAIPTGFQPDLAIVKRTTNIAANWRTSAMPVNVGQYLAATAQDATGALYTTLDATSFSVGATNNTASGIYHFVAFKENAGAVDVGTYGGNGTDNTNIAGVGFQPDWMFTKQTGAIGAVQNQRESHGDFSGYFADATGISNAIQMLQPDGFQLGANNTANAAATTYYYAAFAGATSPPAPSGTFSMISGSYTGNGDSQVIANLGFTPDLVVIKGATAQAGVFTSRLMGGDSSAFLDSPQANFAGGVTALWVDSFTVGNNASVNSDGVTYYWTAYGNAWNPETGTGSADFSIGAYTGSGADNFTIGSQPFQPDFVVAKRNGASGGVWRTSEHVGDLTSFFTATAEGSNRIQALVPTGFQVGSDASSNTIGNLYWFFTFATSTNFTVGTYSGTGSEQTVTVGFQPYHLWIKHTGATQGVLRPSALSGDGALPFVNSGLVSDAIEGTTGTGFTVGIAAETNTSGANNYRYVAWKKSVRHQVHYHFRADDGTEATASSLTGGVEDTPLTNTREGIPYRLRMEVSNEGGVNADASAFRIEYAEKVTTCGAVAEWTRVGDVGGAWDMYDSANLTDGDNTTNLDEADGGTTDENTTFLTPNGGVRDTSDETGVLTLLADQFVEFEFALTPTMYATDTTQYCFRLSGDGTPLSEYQIYPEATFAVHLMASTTGTQEAQIDIPSSGVHVGGAFVFYDVTGNDTHTITDLTVTESGTVNAQTNLDNIELRYEYDQTFPYDCVDETYDGSEGQFGLTDADGFSSANGTSTFAGSLTASSTQAVCVYPLLDVGSNALSGETIELSIDSTADVGIAGGDAIRFASSTLALTGTTVLADDLPTQIHYHFRLDNGNEAGAGSATGGVEDTQLTNLSKSTARRIRMEVSNEGLATTSAIAYRLEYAPRQDTCAATASGWTDVGAAGGHWDMYNSTNLTEAADTTNIAAGIGGVTDENDIFLTPNGGVRDTSSQTGAVTLEPEEFVELEYAVVALAAAGDGETYCFRVTDAGTPLKSYATYPEATIAADALVVGLGAHAGFVRAGATDHYLGGSWAIRDLIGSRTVDGITFSEQGTVDAQADLSNIRIYYEYDTSSPYTCASESFSGNEAQYGATSTAFTAPDGTVTFTDTANITATQALCVYMVLDVGLGATTTETIQMSIANPGTDVAVSSGLVNPNDPVGPTGSTTIERFALTQSHYHFRNDNGDEASATSATGDEDIALSNVLSGNVQRLRFEVSNEGATSSPEGVFTLEYAERVTTCDAAGGWNVVGSPGVAWSASVSDNLTHGEDTSNIATTTGGVTDENDVFLTPNEGVVEGTTTSSALLLMHDEFVELEYVLEANDTATEGATYCFRLTQGGVPLDAYNIYAEATMGTDRDFYIQRGVTDILNGNSTASIVAGVDYTAPRASTSAFIRITNAAFTGAGTTASGGAQNADRVTTSIQNASNIETGVTFVRYGNVNPTRIYWEIVEYIGPPGGDNEIKVHAQQQLAYGSADLYATTSVVNGVIDDADMVPFITGQRSAATNVTTYPAVLSTSVWNSADDTATFTRGASGVAATVSYALIEFTGANWKVQRSQHLYTAAGVTQTESITPVNDMSRAFLHAQKRVGSSDTYVGEFGHQVWLSGVGQVSYSLSSARNPGQHTSVAWVIENTQTNGNPMVVTRSNGTQPAEVTEPYTYSVAIGTTVSATNNSSLFFNMVGVGTNTNHPRAIMGAGITSTTFYQLWISDSGAGRSYRTEVVDWPTAVLTLEQRYYRWYTNNDLLDPTDAWPPGATELGENTAITSLDAPPTDGDVLRLRMSVLVRGSSVSQATRQFKLQYGVRSTTCGAIATWYDTGDSASTTALWRGYNATPADGTVLSGNPPTGGDLNLSVSDRAGTYEEANPTVYNPYKILINEDVEYDWILEAHGIVDKTTYCFRMLEADGTPLDAYDEEYPTLTTAGFEVVQGDWRFFDDESSLTPTAALAATNTAPTGVDVADILKLRVNVEEIAGKAGSNVKFKLQFSPFSDFSVAYDVADSDTCTSGSRWCYADGAGDDGARIDGKALLTGDTCVGGVGDGCGTHNEYSYAPDVVGEVGTTSVTGTEAVVNLQHTYDDPVFIVEAISGDTGGGGGNRPAAAIITATTTSSFSVRIQEPDSEPDTHGAEMVAYLVMERGAYQLPDGRRVDVGTLDTAQYYGNSVAGDSDATCAFTQTFASAPVVFSALQSNNNTATPNFLTVSQNLVGTDDFACAIEVPDGVSSAPGSAETIGWIAIEGGTFTNNAVDLVATSTTSSITGWSDTPWYEYVWPLAHFTRVPGIVASKQTRNGTEGGWVRYGSVGVDSALFAIDVADVGDRSHVAEIAGLFAFSEQGVLYRGGASAVSFPAGATAEFEFTLTHFDAEVGQTYFFRLYDVSADLPVGTSTAPGSYPSIVAASGAVTFTISGIESGSSTEGVLTDVTTTPTSIAFGVLPMGVDKTAAQRLTVSTNANAGYQVLAYERQDLIAGTGAVISDVLGTNPSPVGWSAGCLVGAQSCYGYHVGDDILSGGSTRFLVHDTFAALTDSLAEVAYSGGPATDESTDIVYRIRANTGQPAGQYESKVVYIVVPVF